MYRPQPAQLRLVIPFLVIAVAGCHIGTRTAEFPPATTAVGVTATISVRGEVEKRKGEVYAVDSAGVLLYDGTLTRVAWSRVRALDVQGLGNSFDLLIDEKLSAAKRDRLAQVSRFPGGLSGSLLQDVLTRIKVDAVTEVR